MEPSAATNPGETPLAPKLPLRLGRFTLCEELGAGGMATVYLARMELAAGLERLVALKTIHPHLAKEKHFVDMFLDEARIASHITHPNVCSTHDFGKVNGVYYLAMEYLLGEPLFDVINRVVERFDDLREVLPFLAARTIADACEGLHAAHVARGPAGEALHIVHRDVSPQNLFLTYDGSVKVVDFGCAKAAQRVAHTSTGVLKGKVGYASPEQIKAKREVDARADVWALGVCLWEFLTLSPLFSRDTAVTTAMAVLEDPIELASDGRPWVPVEVAQIAARALSRDVDARYPSARELGRALRNYIADSGFTLESAELAEWMSFLFDDRQVTRIAQAQRVQEMDISEVDQMDLYIVSDDEVEELAADPEPLYAEPLDEADEEPPFDLDADTGVEVAEAELVQRTAPAPSAGPAPNARPARWPWVLLTIAILAVGGYYLQLYYEPAPWLLELFGSPPTSDAPDPEPLTQPDGPAATAAGADTETSDTETSDTDSADTDTADTDTSDTESPSQTAAAETNPASPAAADSSGSSNPTEEAESTSRRRRRSSGGGVTTVVSGGYVPSPTALPAEGVTTVSANAARNPAMSASVPDPVRSGLVRVTASVGWATVYVDGQLIGRTPVRRELPEGRHSLRFLPYGEEPAETLAITVEASLEQTIRLDIQPRL